MEGDGFEPTFERTSKEGWVLSERGDGLYEIQRYDEDPEETFENDYKAFLYVKSMAESGSKLHSRAIALDGKPWGETA